MGRGSSKIGGGSGGRNGGSSNKYNAEALEYYREDGYYINNILRHGDELDDREKDYVKALDEETTKATVNQDVLYRVVDADTVFKGMDDFEYMDLRSHLLFGDNAYDKGQYSQNKKKRMEKLVDSIEGKSELDKGFISTTTNLETALHKVQGDDTHGTKRVVLKFTNARGKKGADMRFMDRKTDYLTPENEFLLQRNNKYTYGKPYVKDNEIFIDARLK